MLERKRAAGRPSNQDRWLALYVHILHPATNEPGKPVTPGWTRSRTRPHGSLPIDLLATICEASRGGRRMPSLN